MAKYYFDDTLSLIGADISSSPVVELDAGHYSYDFEYYNELTLTFPRYLIPENCPPNGSEHETAGVFYWVIAELNLGKQVETKEIAIDINSHLVSDLFKIPYSTISERRGSGITILLNTEVD